MHAPKFTSSMILAVISSITALGLAVALYAATREPSATSPEPAAVDVSASALPATHDIKGSLLVGGAFGVDPFECDYVVDQMRCLTRQLRQATAISDGETRPYPQGPGGGFADFRDGAQVVLRDGSSNAIGVGQLEGGTLSYRGVGFDFSLVDVPEMPIYELTIGGRGPTVYPIADLEEADWQIDLTIGD